MFPQYGQFSVEERIFLSPPITPPPGMLGTYFYARKQLLF